MKVCTYCGTHSTDNAVICKSCGAAEFDNKCNSCGTKFTGSVCPECGDIISGTGRDCPICGHITDDLICPYCETDLSGKNQEPGNAQKTIYYENSHVTIQVTNVQSKEQVELNIKQMKKIGRRNAILLVSAIFFLSVLILINRYRPAEIREILQDMGVVNTTNHPKYFSEYENALEFWKGNDFVKVIKEGEVLTNAGALLVMTSDTKTEMISDIRINLSGYSMKEKPLIVGDVLKVICEYIPYDIITKYYSSDKAFYEIIKAGEQEKYYYLWVLNEKGKQEIRKGNKALSDKLAFEVVYDREEGWNAQIGVFSYDENEDSTSVQEWDIDISAYFPQ